MNMKEKIKNILFIISIFYSVVIIVSMIFTTINMVDIVDLSDTRENKSKLKEYKAQVSLLEENKCTKMINKIIKHYEETSYDGNVKIKEMFNYDFDDSLLSYYGDTQKACNISEEDAKKYNLPFKFVAASIQRDELYQRYYFQYELNFRDIYMRDIGQAVLTGIEYNINRSNILEIISDLIEISSREVIVNE